jgi:hypothetical protein
MGIVCRVCSNLTLPGSTSIVSEGITYICTCTSAAISGRSSAPVASCLLEICKLHPQSTVPHTMATTLTEVSLDAPKPMAGPSNHTLPTSGGGSALYRSNTTGESIGQDDLELMTMPSVVGRESGERDPLLLRGSIMSDEAIKGLKQSVKVMLCIHTSTDQLAGEKAESWPHTTKLRMTKLPVSSSLFRHILQMENKMSRIWHSR